MYFADILTCKSDIRGNWRPSLSEHLLISPRGQYND